MKQGVLVILGHKGSGKTQMARRFLEAVPRSVCIDTIGEYGGVVIEDPFSLVAYLERARHLSRFRVSYRDTGNTQVPPEVVFKMLQGLRDGWICLEEASKWMGHNTTPDEIRWFLQYGRHNQLSVLLVSRRPQELDRMGTAMADTIVSFKQHEPRDLEYISKIGGAEAADRISSLGEFEWDYVLDTHPEIRGVLDSISDETGERDARLDSGTVEPSSDGDPAGPLVGAQAPEQGGAGAGDRAEGAGSAGLVPEPGQAGRDGEAGSGGGSGGEGNQAGGGGAGGRRRGRKARAPIHST